jgi:hypothetical protein
MASISRLITACQTTSTFHFPTVTQRRLWIRATWANCHTYNQNKPFSRDHVTSVCFVCSKSHCQQTARQPNSHAFVYDRILTKTHIHLSHVMVVSLYSGACPFNPSPYTLRGSFIRKDTLITHSPLMLHGVVLFLVFCFLNWNFLPIKPNVLLPTPILGLWTLRCTPIQSISSTTQVWFTDINFEKRGGFSLFN